MEEGDTLSQRALVFQNFDWIFLAELLVFSAVTILFLFYFNRVLGYIVSRIIRTYTWHRYQVYVDFQALQISLLGGRIFFKGVRYHGENETLIIHDGYITWRYWFRRVRQVNLNRAGRYSAGAEDGANNGAPSQTDVNDKLPCRILIEARGVEWFIYNRSPAYETILASTLQTPKTTENGTPTPANVKYGGFDEDTEKQGKQLPSASDEGVSSGATVGDASSKLGHDPFLEPDPASNDTKSFSTTLSQESEKTQLSLYLQTLPIGIECSRGAIIIGNEHTRSVLVAKFDNARGRVDARASGPLDHYRQTFDFAVSHPVIQLKPNDEYTESLLEAAARLKQDQKELGKQGHFSLQFRRKKRKAMHSLRGLIPYFRTSVETLIPESQIDQRGASRSKAGVSLQDRWLGLSRYLEEDEDCIVEQERWKAIEYGQFNTIADCPSVSVCFFWDVPGLVSGLASSQKSKQRSPEDYVNGEKSPAWGVDIKVEGGNINYGPWADRQRTDLQAVFLPSSYTDSFPAKALRPGQSRVSTEFTIVVELDEAVSLRIPTREESKDWKWKGRAATRDSEKTRQIKKRTPKRKKGDKSILTPEVRPAGWLDVTISKNSSIKYTMDMFANEEGYRNCLGLDLKNLEISSSVNHGVLLRSKSQSLTCDLSNPLGWNTPRHWHFNILGESLEVFILRDHAFLLIDLLSDWTTGPAGEYLTFVPFTYNIGLQFPNFRFFLNANDSNIINNPSDLDDNTFISIWGETLTANVSIPLDEYRPLQSKVTFDVDAYHGGFKLSTPTWNTQHTLLDSQDVATLKVLKVGGSYNYYTSTSPSSTDALLLHVHGFAPTIHAYGFLIRYFLNFKDNYFGEDLHFQTSEEYQQQLSNKNAREKQEREEALRAKQSNDLDVIITVALDDACLMLPSNLYSAKENVKLDLSSILIDLRYTNYYMDLEVNLSPLTLTRAIPGNPQTFGVSSDSSTQAFVDGIVISGHRLFGLPPTEPTYVCNWDFAVGAVTGECSLEFLGALVQALRCLIFSFNDVENALPHRDSLILHDVTFLRAKIEPVQVWVHVDNSAFLFRTDSIKLDFNDWAGQKFSDRLHLEILNVILASVDDRAASRSRTKRQAGITTYAYVETSIDLRMVATSPEFRTNKHLQQAHIETQDTRTRRTPWLLLDAEPIGTSQYHDQSTKIRPPAMPYPSMPEPFKTSEDFSSLQQSRSHTSFISTRSRMRTSRQSSFISSLNREELPVGHITKNSPALPLRQSSSKSSRPELTKSAAVYTGLLNGQSRQASYQTSRESQQHKDALSPASTTSSSSFQVPYFPLFSIEPDTSDVPLAKNETLGNMDHSMSEEVLSTTDESMPHMTFIIQLGSGIRAFCTPEALQHMRQLLDGLQPTQPAAILDNLQIDGMAGIASKQAPSTPPKPIQLRLEVPFVGIRFRNQIITSKKGLTVDHCYELDASQLIIKGRLGLQVSEVGILSNSSLHASLKELSLVAKCGSRGHLEDQARITLNLQGTIIWLVYGEAITGEARFEALELVSLNSEVENLASLLAGTVTLSDHVISQFESVLDSKKWRQQFVVYWLVTSGGSLPDPAFLTTASYVLRSATSQPRGSDTWKMLSRLRYILYCSSANAELQLAKQCLHGALIRPDNSMDQVISYFNHWRSWDLAHVRASALMQELYGSLNDETASERSFSSLPIKVTLEVGLVQVVISPGPNQNELELEKLIIACTSSQKRADSLAELENASIIQNSITSHISSLQVLCVRNKIHLNWDICELLEGILVQVNNRKRREDKGTSHDFSTSFAHTAHTINIVLVLETSDFCFETINMKITSLNRGMAASLVATTAANERFNFVSILSADDILSHLSTQSKAVMKSRLLGPNIHISLQNTKSSLQVVKTWKLAAVCGALELDIEDDILGILGTVEIVLSDELVYLQSIFNAGKEAPAKISSAPKGDPLKELYQVHLIMLLDRYNLAATILPSLRYRIEGSVVRSSIVPKSDVFQSYTLDFDIMDHNHVFHNHSNGSTQEIAALPLPPINGQILFNRNNTTSSVTIFMAIEKIMLDASSVHGLLTTYSRTEILNFRNNFIREVDSIKLHSKAILGFSTAAANTSPSSQGVFIYSANIIATGLLIQYKSSKTSVQSARLASDLDLIYLRSSNRGESGSEQLLHPEIALGVRNVKILLERSAGRLRSPCGDVSFTASFMGTSRQNENQILVRSYQIRCDGLEVNLYTETASMVVDILGTLQQRFKSLDLSEEVRTLRARRLIRTKSQAIPVELLRPKDEGEENEVLSSLFTSMYSLEMNDIQVTWRVGDITPISPGHEIEDLVLSFTKIHLATKKENAARLMIENFQLQMVPTSQSKKFRSYNSALLPEVVFNVAYLSTLKDRRLAFQAAGKSLDLRLTSQFILPASDLQRSMGIASSELRKVVAGWNAFSQTESQKQSILGSKKLSSLLIDADFAGALVYIQGKKGLESQGITSNIIRGEKIPTVGRYGQFTSEDARTSTTLTAPGIALKVEYKDMGSGDPSLNAEIKVDASSNILYPTVVPLILEISSSVKALVGEPAEPRSTLDAKSSPTKFLDEDPFGTADPAAILGNCRLNLGLRICHQEFGLSCQPVARVAATARFEDIYITVNTVQAQDQSRFFAISGTFTRLEASVQHVYSRESTGSFEVDSINISLMNSKHINNAKGLSAILKISPMNVLVNAKQLHDFLLFREIWVPIEMRHSSRTSPASAPGSQAIAIERYQQVAAAGAFPWNATVYITKLDVQLDLGQALGKSTFSISNLWVSSKKTSDWEQNLCLGFDKVGIDSAGRMSGFIELQKLKLRTSIQWPAREEARNSTPLVQASLTFADLRVQAGFDYQSFLVADLRSLEFLMYNVRDSKRAGGDRLVGVVNGDTVQVFCTTTSAAQGLALYQAVQRLIQERQSAYENSLRDIEKFLRRKSVITPPSAIGNLAKVGEDLNETIMKTPIQLHTSVVVSLKAIKIGAFPKTFLDNQIFKLEALDASARFTVSLEDGQVHSGLGLNLGQLRIALSAVSRPNVPKDLSEISVDDAVSYATGSRGGTILKVPKVVATMHTWQKPQSNQIDYIFKSSFEGKVEVGWNYSRISFIRGMWANHSRALAARLGKPLPPSALQITGGPQADSEGQDQEPDHQGQEKITAIVHMPQSKYQYTALEPPIIETPQLRDMGEATPPLEWIGLHRERLPNLTHQIVIVTLLEVAKEVEDAYSKILGSS